MKPLRTRIRNTPLSLFHPIVLLSLLGMFFLGCTPPTQPSTTGSVWFNASVSQVLSSADVARVQVTVSSSDMTSVSVDLDKSGGAWIGLLDNLPPGSDFSFRAQAYDTSGTALFQGQVSGVTLPADQTTVVALSLQQVTPPAPYANEAPLIDFIIASASFIQPGASISLSASAHDPNTGDTLALAWTASAGTFSAPSAATSSWTAPNAPGLQTLTLTVTDSQGVAASVSVAIHVLSSATGNAAAIEVSFNHWPTVSKLSSRLNRLEAGQSTTVSVLAKDADSDDLSYAWASSCAGDWTNATSASAAFVPSSIPSGACNNCQLSVTVQDGRG